MRNVKDIPSGKRGVTVGIRKDGSVAVLFDDDSLAWYSASEFSLECEVV